MRNENTHIKAQNKCTNVSGWLNTTLDRSCVCKTAWPWELSHMTGSLYNSHYNEHNRPFMTSLPCNLIDRFDVRTKIIYLHNILKIGPLMTHSITDCNDLYMSMYCTWPTSSTWPRTFYSIDLLKVYGVLRKESGSHNFLHKSDPWPTSNSGSPKHLSQTSIALNWIQEAVVYSDALQFLLLLCPFTAAHWVVLIASEGLNHSAFCGSFLCGE